MDQLGQYILAQDILSKKSPEAIADETRHGNRSTFVNIPVNTLTKTGIRLDQGLSNSPHDFGEGREGMGTSISLIDLIAPTYIDDELNEQSLKCLITRMKKMIMREVRIGQDRTRNTKKYAQVFERLCAGNTEIDIAKVLKISRERVRQIKETLKTLECMGKFKMELKGDYSGLKW